jgi:hypothetical protein
MTAVPELDLSRIAPLTDAEAARLVSPATFADLASQITATPVPARRSGRLTGAAGSSLIPFRTFSRPPRRRLALLTAFPVALAAVAGLTVAVGGPDRGGDGPGSAAAIEAMSFTKENGTVRVVIKNIYADTSWYNADLARHHLDITLRLLPVPPSFVGFIDGYDVGGPTAASYQAIKPISAPGSCGMSGTDCQIGFTVPVSFRGKANMWIGRPARPGEQYQATGSAFNKGEPLYGLSDQLIGRRVSEALPVLARHGVTVAQCRDQGDGMWGKGVCDPAAIPGGWYVVDVSPWAPGQVMVTIQTQP